MSFPVSLDLFCRVVDNFGDIGVCWRLSRQLAAEHGLRVILWVDDLASFRRICPAIDPESDAQRAGAVEIRRWSDAFGEIGPASVADVVVEAFACELPATYVAAMAAREHKPVWINLEYLSAEAWVEGCHAMPSRHPSLPLTKYFFFPGFTDRTGGLLAEADLAQRRQAFQDDPQAAAGFFRELGVRVPDGASKLSLFCYPDAPVDALFSALQNDSQASICLVPDGVATVATAAFLQQPAKVGASVTRGALTVQLIPFVDQRDYDKLLWACDLNFVRGEDSFVRAQWAARPFVWHIYPQDEGAHWSKLQAFLDRYEIGMPDAPAQVLTNMWKVWNGAAGTDMDWHSFNSTLPEMSRHATQWARQLVENGDLASNLIQFARKFS
jgi:uncharacterized repeat protein (TIGR03837 family)